MTTLANTRTLDVKTVVRSALVEVAEYKKMYSTLSKRDGSLRLKYYDVKTEGRVSSLVEKLSTLGLGKVEKLATGKFGLKTKPVWSLVVHVDSDKVN